MIHLKSPAFKRQIQDFLWDFEIYTESTATGLGPVSMHGGSTQKDVSRLSPKLPLNHFKYMHKKSKKIKKK